MSATPPKVSLNHPLLFAIGTAMWLLALGVLAALQATGHLDRPEWLWICGVGVALGVVGVIYSRHSWRAKNDQ
ncbi:MAG: DUF2530 domain-containing protein [Bifidobacteriaceae bacterium]|nr:DUF2530 domain-containing protein [Bifidobacteriaceae bacterium]